MDLAELELIFGDGIPCAVEDDEARAGGALVNGAYETVLGVVMAASFVLDERAVAIVALVGMTANLGDVLLLDVVVDV